MKKKLKKLSFNAKLLIILLILSPLMYMGFEYLDYKTNYDLSLSTKGLGLLNDYEFPYYMVDTSNKCMSPYDVGDGVITFGPGITYPTEQEGLDHINSLYKTNYTEDKDCIDTEILFALQEEILSPYENTVSNFAWNHRYPLEQNEFDGLLLLSYNSPNLFQDEDFNHMFETTFTKDEYINTINNYYSKLNGYDEFGEGWLIRINDSAATFFDSNYEYQTY